MVEMARASRFVFADELDYDSGLVEKHHSDRVRELLFALAKGLSDLDEEDFKQSKIEENVRSTLKEGDATLGDVAQACRVALTGREVSPGLFATMELLGKEKTISRLQHFAELN